MEFVLVNICMVWMVEVIYGSVDDRAEGGGRLYAR